MTNAHRTQPAQLRIAADLEDVSLAELAIMAIAVVLLIIGAVLAWPAVV